MVCCDECGKNSPMYTSEVDHIDPVTPIMISGKVMSFSMLFERTFCDLSNLQILCKDCHKAKSKQEMGDRVRWRKLKKWLVCRHQGGSRMEVIGITKLKELAEYWEVLFVSALKKEAEAEMKRRKKL